MSTGVPATEAETPAIMKSTSHAAVASSNPLRAGWERWKKLAHAVGVVQTRFLLVIFYFIVVAPLGLVMRLSEDKLHLREPKDTCWSPHNDEQQSIETARRQF